MLGLDPFSGAAFVFRSKRADRIKILVWDRTGLVLVHNASRVASSCGQRLRTA
ncbi:IS66 family insertion sequence element accessory protein TnpB, partial [Bradyrhizobium sp. CIR3A]|uniref:IS66 family insertion sequence element accessory protein TnpB n=1 Tax=Bradyrhizobium sp. CIR3A TaxID=2663838 RepID=UPI0016058920